MKTIIQKAIQQAAQLIECDNKEAAIITLRDIDNRWEAAREEAASQPDKNATTELYIAGKQALIHLLHEEAQTPITRKEIDSIYRKLIVLEAESRCQTKVIREYAAWLTETGEYPCSEIALGHLYLSLAEYFENESFHLCDGAIYAEKALDCFKLVGMSAEIAFCSSYLAGILKATGNWEDSIPLYREALTIYRSPKKDNDQTYSEGRARCAQNLANILRYIGDKNEARDLYREAISIWKDAEYTANQVYFSKAAYSLATLLGSSPREDEEACSLLSQSIAILRHGRLAQKCCDELCCRLRSQGKRAEAERVETEVYSA